MDDKIETWSDIQGYENRYQISSIGRVRNLKTNRILKSERNGTGKKFDLPPISKNVDVNVAMAFIDNPNRYKYVKHIDGDIFNNSVDNLEWTSEQVSKYPKLKIDDAENGKNRIGKFDRKGNFIKSFANLKEASEDLGKPHPSISMCLNGKRKTAYGYRWSYL